MTRPPQDLAADHGSAPAVAPEEITAEEIASLPKPEDITAATDLRLFLRKGVPDALRNAALRRLWSVDPSIRDFEAPARDYAWDWNVPGGVPGNGPLLPSDDIDLMLRRVFGESPADAADSPAKTSQQELQPREDAVRLSSDAPRDDAAAAQHAPADPNSARPPENGPDTAGGQAEPDASLVAHRAAPQQDAGDLDAAALRTKRHGGARPV